MLAAFSAYLCFFLCCVLDHLALHSFPTRRSSDLLGTKLKLVKGYAGSAALRLAMERGEIDGFCGVTFSSDRKSTRLNSSHLGISYAVFCLKKKRLSVAARRVSRNRGVIAEAESVV